jgi:hypothetical protein
MQAASSRGKTCDPSPDVWADALAFVVFKLRLASDSLPHTGSRDTAMVNPADEPAHAHDGRFYSVSDIGIFRGYLHRADLDKIPSSASAGGDARVDRPITACTTVLCVSVTAALDARCWFASTMIGRSAKW